MSSRPFSASLLGTAILAALALAMPSPAGAHCDGLDGPVVEAARRAIERNDPSLVLIWVLPKDEAEIRSAFAQTLSVRALGPQAKDLADRYLFETLVRLHRAGEGAPYTGLKPAGRDLGPAIPAADKALETGDPAPLLRMLTASVEKGVHERFQEARAVKAFRPDDIAAGRAYVHRYVAFIHYVERLYGDATHPAEGHAPEEPEAAAGPHGHGAH